MTNDHSFVQYLVDTGQLTPEQAETHPQRSVLLRVLGDSQEDVTLDESHPEFTVGDRWLLCSDGLCGFVSGPTIGKILYRSETPQQACESLVELALKAGGPDNITCVVADIVEDPQETEPRIVGAAATDRLSQLRSQQKEDSRDAATKADRDASDTASKDKSDPEDENEDSSFSQARAAIPTESLAEEDPAPKYRWGRIIGVIVGLLILIALFAGALWYGMSARPTPTPSATLTSVSETQSPAATPEKTKQEVEPSTPAETSSSASANNS